jgi:hypothetical protein
MDRPVEYVGPCPSIRDESVEESSNMLAAKGLMMAMS